MGLPAEKLAMLMVETWRWIKTPYSIFLLVLNVGNFREWSQSSLVIIIPATHPFPAVETKQEEFLWLLRLQPVAVKNPQLSLPEMDSNSTWIGGEAGIGFTWVLPHFLVANYLLYYIIYISSKHLQRRHDLNQHHSISLVMRNPQPVVDSWFPFFHILVGSKSLSPWDRSKRWDPHLGECVTHITEVAASAK